MDLILWRHAEAEDGEPDMDRKLTAKGRRQARRMARWLRDHAPKHARMICSPARRTRQTADALGRSYEVVDELAPGCSMEQLLKASGWPQGAGEGEGEGKGDGVLILVGHNPAISQLASRILAGTVFPMYLRKGGVMWFTSRTRDDEPDAVLRAAMIPSMLRHDSR